MKNKITAGRQSDKVQKNGADIAPRSYPFVEVDMKGHLPGPKPLGPTDGIDLRNRVEPKGPYREPWLK